MTKDQRIAIAVFNARAIVNIMEPDGDGEGCMHCVDLANDLTAHLKHHIQE